MRHWWLIWDYLTVYVCDASSQQSISRCHNTCKDRKLVTLSKNVMKNYFIKTPLKLSKVFKKKCYALPQMMNHITLKIKFSAAIKLKAIIPWRYLLYFYFRISNIYTTLHKHNTTDDCIQLCPTLYTLKPKLTIIIINIFCHFNRRW